MDTFKNTRISVECYLTYENIIDLIKMTKLYTFLATDVGKVSSSRFDSSYN